MNSALCYLLFHPLLINLSDQGLNLMNLLNTLPFSRRLLFLLSRILQENLARMNCLFLLMEKMKEIDLQLYLCSIWLNQAFCGVLKIHFVEKRWLYLLLKEPPF